jgi:integrase
MARRKSCAIAKGAKAMSVTVRRYKRGGWEVDIRTVLPDGTNLRERRKAPVGSKSGAKRWGERRESELILEQRETKAEEPPKPGREVPTLADFAPRFLDGYARANRQKPSTISSKESILRVHLVPLLGTTKLDAITNEDVQNVKNHLHDRAATTVNTVLTTLSVMLKVAVEWDVTESVPCTIKLLRVAPAEADFHDFHEYERLADSAQAVGPIAHLVVLLGGDAGLRCGEMMALKWTDIDFSKRMLHVKRSEWRGEVTVPKGGRSRRIPMTTRLSAALQGHRHLRGARVLSEGDGRPITKRVIQRFVERASRRANLAKTGVHILRHSFCSHLAMRGAPAKAIQELAGHRDLSTTQRYMHLSPAAVEGAIRLLEQPAPVSRFGDILETGSAAKVNAKD